MVAAWLLFGMLASGASGARADRWQAWEDADGSPAVETVRELHVDQLGFSPGTRGEAGVLHVQFQSTVAQRITVAAYDSAGRLVRTIDARDVEVGPVEVRWDGRGTSGPLPDGDYEVVIEAEHGGQSMSVSDVVRIDRRAPALSLDRRSVRLTSRTPQRFALPVRLSEPAQLHLRVLSGSTGRGARTMAARAAGRSTVPVPVTSRTTLRRALARGGTRVRVHAVATDLAGNRTARILDLALLPPLAAAPTSGGDSGGSSTDDGTYVWPLHGVLTSRFGLRWGRMHNGIDIAAPTGRPIVAARAGTVTYAGWMSGYGNVVVVDHGSTDTLYAHMSRFATGSGRSIGRGQRVGYVGSTGNSTGPHLHFEVRVSGTARDPLQYLS